MRRIPGTKALKTWMAGPPRRTQGEVAAALDVTQQTISRITNGARPGLMLAVRIRGLTGIPLEAWFGVDPFAGQPSCQGARPESRDQSAA